MAAQNLLKQGKWKFRNINLNLSKLMLRKVEQIEEASWALQELNMTKLLTGDIKIDSNDFHLYRQYYSTQIAVKSPSQYMDILSIQIQASINDTIDAFSESVN